MSPSPPSLTAASTSPYSTALVSSEPLKMNGLLAAALFPSSEMFCKVADAMTTVFTHARQFRF